MTRYQIWYSCQPSPLTTQYAPPNCPHVNITMLVGGCQGHGYRTTTIAMKHSYLYIILTFVSIRHSYTCKVQKGTISIYYETNITKNTLTTLSTSQSRCVFIKPYANPNSKPFETYNTHNTIITHFIAPTPVPTSPLLKPY